MKTLREKALTKEYFAQKNRSQLFLLISSDFIESCSSKRKTFSNILKLKKKTVIFLPGFWRVKREMTLIHPGPKDFFSVKAAVHLCCITEVLVGITAPYEKEKITP